MNPKRKYAFTDSPFEERVGFSRAVRSGSYVVVAGTAPVAPGGGAAHPGDPYRQAIYIFTRIEKALQDVGAKREHVVRTRMFITSMEHQDAVSRAHHEFFKEIRPAATMVGISGLVDPEMLVEIEVDAIVDDE